MSAVKRTPIPLPGRATAAAGTPSKPPKPTTKPTPKDDSSEDESSSDESSSSETVAAKTSSSTKEDLKKAQKPAPKSSSEASDSEESEEEEEEEEEEEDEEEEESSDNGDKNEKAEEPKKADASKSTTASGSASASDSGSEESESESEEESEKQAQTSSFSRSQTVQLSAAKSFEPPSGFKAVNSGLSSSSNLAKLLQSTDLSKKQIWHITAPAHIDIKKIKQFARGKAALKEPAIEHDGVGYAFLPEEKGTQTSKKLLVPSEKGFAAVPAEISETLHLKQIVDIPKLSEKGADSAKTTAAIHTFVERPPKPARPQPAGLRMRYRPYGHSGDVIGFASDDESSAPAQKRKHGEADVPASSKKSKKEKTPKKKKSEAGEPMEGVEATAVAQDGGETEKKKKKKKKEKKDKEGKKEKKKEKKSKE